MSDNKAKPIIGKTTFYKIDIRAGTIEKVEDIKESKKLVKSWVGKNSEIKKFF